VFTARYALSPCIKQIRFVFKGLIEDCVLHTRWHHQLLCSNAATNGFVDSMNVFHVRLHKLHTGRSHFMPGLLSWKSYTNQVQNFCLKQCICWGFRGLTTSSYIAYDYSTRWQSGPVEYIGLYTAYTTYIFIQYTYISIQYIYLFIMQ
jgi:hypothetical protein